MVRATGAGGAVVSVLDFDSGLGSGVHAEDWETARRLCRAKLVRVPSGTPVLPVAASASDLLELVIVDGLVCRELALRDRRMLELLGSGDVVHPPVESNPPRLGSRVAITAVLDTKLLALGGSFMAAAARWPCLLRNLHDRLESQRNRFAVQGLIAHLPLAADRLLLILHHLAERWGFVTVEGTVVPLPLSHDVLGQLAAARRSTITLALSALQRDGQLRRLDDGSWLLAGAAEVSVQSIAKTNASTPPLGKMLALRAGTIEHWQSERALRAEARLAGHQPLP